MISRRAFLLGSSIMGAGGMMLAAPAKAAFKDTTLDLTLSQTEIFIPSLPEAFSGFKIGMISDTHLGSCSSTELLTKAVDLLSKEKIDLLVLAGDYVLMLDLFSSRFFYNRTKHSGQLRSCNMDYPGFSDSLSMGQHYFKEMANQVSRLNPVHGIVAVLGNHDRWNSAENCCRIFQESGIEPLVNRGIGLSKAGQELNLYGCDDYTTGVPIAPPSSSGTRIIISHNPDFLSELAQAGCFALGLAGHTHGGQINLPLLGAVALNIQDTELIQGLTLRKQSQIFVGRGVGTSGLPWRINCPPEVNILTLRS